MIESGTRRLLLGTMNFGRRTSRSEAIAIVRRAVELGIRHVDTANAYNDGASEEIVGEAVRPLRDRVQIATKVGFGRVAGKPEGLSRARILAACDESRARLGVDRVDLYYLHVPDHGTPLEESVAAMGELVAAGRIGAWGVSNYASWQIVEMEHIAERLGVPAPVASQQLYNVLIRQLDVEYFRFAKAHPIHTAVYNPLAGGLLTDRGLWTDGADVAGTRFDRNPLYRGRYWHDAMKRRALDVANLAREIGRPIAELAYAWVLARPGVDSVIAGPATVDHLDAAARAADLPLPAEVMTRLDAMHVAWSGTESTYAR
jgi:aryl-alcohol dehydrogenase-like predicted oxidoreductase